MFSFVKKLKHYFVPHSGNSYCPHFFRPKALGVVSLFAVAVLALSISYSVLISRTNFLASVLPSVLVDLANQDRSLYQLTPLTRNSTLEAAAREKANDMAKYSYFAHISPTGITPWYWFTKNGYRFLYAGENLAINFTDSGDVNTAWMNSPGHRANILNQQFTEIGIATAEGMYEGRPTTFVAQYFGRPIPQAAPIAPSSPVAVAPVKVTEPKVIPVTETNTFIAVKNAEVEVPTTTATAVVTSATLGATQYATLPQKVLSSPHTMLDFIYFILIAIILGAIVVSLFVEMERHHGKHLVSGLALIVFILVLAYAYDHIQAGTLAIL